MAVMQRVYDLIPRALARQRSAVSLLGWAKIAIDFENTNDLNKESLQLVNRCFKILEQTSYFDFIKKRYWKSDIETITQVYQGGISFLTDANVNAYFTEVTDAEMRRQAGGVSGGAFTHGGDWSKRLPAQGIFINKDVCAAHTDDWLLDALTHEFAHFCGPVPPDEVGDKGYGDSALALPREKALKNASNHAWFAGLSQTARFNWPNGTYPS